MAPSPPASITLLNSAGISYQAAEFAAFPVSTGPLTGALGFYTGIPENWRRSALYQSTDGTYAVTAAQKQVRVLTFDFSDFGLDASNFADATDFVHTLSGQSDIAFTAYNRQSTAVNRVDITVNAAVSDLPCPVEAGNSGQLVITVANNSDSLASKVPLNTPLPAQVDVAA